MALTHGSARRHAMAAPSQWSCTSGSAYGRKRRNPLAVRGQDDVLASLHPPQVLRQVVLEIAY